MQLFSSPYSIFTRSSRGQRRLSSEETTRFLSQSSRQEANLWSRRSLHAQCGRIQQWMPPFKGRLVPRFIRLACERISGLGLCLAVRNSGDLDPSHRVHPTSRTGRRFPVEAARGEVRPDLVASYARPSWMEPGGASYYCSFTGGACRIQQNSVKPHTDVGRKIYRPPRTIPFRRSNL